MSRLSILSLQNILTSSDKEAWSGIMELLLSIWSDPYPSGSPLSEIKRREDLLVPWDLILSHVAWELWRSFESSTEVNSKALASFWTLHCNGKAILILDGLSLREMPVLIEEASRRGLLINQSPRTKATQLPSDTNAFAHSLGFLTRGSLDNNGGNSKSFPGAWTTSNNLPWLDSSRHIPPHPSIIYWHSWPDDLIHQYDGNDGGLDRLIPAINKELRSEDFWYFVAKMAAGRSLVITSDHGYANSGAFFNADADQKEDLKSLFSAQRYRLGAIQMKDWLPPLALTLGERDTPFTAVLGRRKWQVPGGFPTLSHGGMTLMETFVPWVEISPIGS